MKSFEKNKNVWADLSKALGCGGCENITTIDSPYTCKSCGRMLCGDCGDFCKDHAQDMKNIKTEVE